MLNPTLTIGIKDLLGLQEAHAALMEHKLGSALGEDVPTNKMAAAARKERLDIISDLFDAAYRAVSETERRIATEPDAQVEISLEQAATYREALVFVEAEKAFARYLDGCAA